MLDTNKMMKRKRKCSRSFTLEIFHWSSNGSMSTVTGVLTKAFSLFQKRKQNEFERASLHPFFGH